MDNLMYSIAKANRNQQDSKQGSQELFRVRKAIAYIIHSHLKQCAGLYISYHGPDLGAYMCVVAPSSDKLLDNEGQAVGPASPGGEVVEDEIVLDDGRELSRLLGCLLVDHDGMERV